MSVDGLPCNDTEVSDIAMPSIAGWASPPVGQSTSDCEEVALTVSAIVLQFELAGSRSVT